MSATAQRDVPAGSERDVAVLFGLVGSSARGTLAPAIFNRAFRDLGWPALCTAFQPRDFGAFWSDVVLNALPQIGVALGGLTVKRPHKEAALAVCRPRGGMRAQRTGAANCVFHREGEWHAANTTGLIELLSQAGVEARGLAVAVVGCGGAGRAVAAELADHAAAVTLVNRGVTRGRYASRRLGLPWHPLEGFRPRGLDLVVNATPLVAELPFGVEELDPGALVADLAYLPTGDTVLIEAARRAGLGTIDGRQVLAAEMAAQFKLMTGVSLPTAAATLALG